MEEGQDILLKGALKMNENEVIDKHEKLIEAESIEENEGIDELLTDEEILQVVTFSLLDDVEYGIDILLIHEILRIPVMSRLPNTPAFVKGVINLRGNVIPVVNVRLRFGSPEAEMTENSRIIVVGINGKLVGLIVDSVFQVVRIPSREVNLSSQLIDGVSSEFIRGVGRLKDRLIVLLNLDNMLFKIEDES